MHIIFLSEWVSIVSLIATCLGVPTLAALIVTDLYKRHKDKVKENDEEEKKRKSAELQANVREAMRPELQPIKDDIVELKVASELTKQSLQATLRHDLYKIADKWLDKGFCPIQDKEDFENIYKKYHALGRNGVMDDVYTKVMELPVSKPRSKSTKRTSTHA